MIESKRITRTILKEEAILVGVLPVKRISIVDNHGLEDTDFRNDEEVSED